MQEQRLNQRLLKYWEMLRKELPFPAMDKFNSGSVDDLWENCCRIVVEHGQQHITSYKYNFVGHHLTTMFGRDLTNLVLDMRMKGFPDVVIVEKLNLVMETKAPVMADGHFTNVAGKLIKYRGCFLPFGGDKTGITHIIMGMSHRVY